MRTNVARRFGDFATNSRAYDIDVFSDVARYRQQELNYAA